MSPQVARSPLIARTSRNIKKILGDARARTLEMMHDSNVSIAQPAGHFPVTEPSGATGVDGSRLQEDVERAHFSEGH